jgi:hypothetical protein
MNDVDVDRLLRAAALTGDDSALAMPFGFDTRVVAIWHANAEAASLGLTRLLRRVALLAGAVMIIATAATYVEATQNRESGEPFANEFAIADSAIADEVSP